MIRHGVPETTDLMYLVDLIQTVWIQATLGISHCTTPTCGSLHLVLCLYVATLELELVMTGHFSAIYVRHQKSDQRWWEWTNKPIVEILCFDPGLILPGRVHLRESLLCKLAELENHIRSIIVQKWNGSKHRVQLLFSHGTWGIQCDNSSWYMGHAMLYNGYGGNPWPWTIGYTTVYTLHGPWVLQ